jgi:MarR family transcriptional regulator, organic hydroperoxide resistance regulator
VKRATPQGPLSERAFPGGLDAVCFTLGRAYYNYLGVLERVLAELGLDQHLRPGMGHILFALFEQDDRVIKDLVARSQLSYSTLSGLLSRMEKAGLVVCRRDKQDGRAVRISLTPLARSLEPKCHAAVQRINEIMLGQMSEKEIAQAQQLLGRMIDATRLHLAGEG